MKRSLRIQPWSLDSRTLREPLLRQVVEGHLVNRVGLCPSTRYCRYGKDTLRLCMMKTDRGKPHFAVTNVETTKPLVFRVNKKKPH